MNLLILPNTSIEVCIEIYSINSFKILIYKKVWTKHAHPIINKHDNLRIEPCINLKRKRLQKGSRLDY